MINFNENDYNITKIKRESKLANLVTKNFYRIYGLKQDGSNPPIFLSYDGNLYHQSDFSNLRDFLKNNGISVQFEENENEDVTSKFFIGIRYDLRKHVLLCAALVQTMVYHLEGRLDLKNNFKIPGIPKLEREEDVIVDECKPSDSPDSGCDDFTLNLIQ